VVDGQVAKAARPPNFGIALVEKKRITCET